MVGAHLGEVAAGGGGVEDGQLEALVGAHNENGARRQRDAGLVLLVRVKHPIPVCYQPLVTIHLHVSQSLGVAWNLPGPSFGRSSSRSSRQKHLPPQAGGKVCCPTQSLEELGGNKNLMSSSPHSPFPADLSARRTKQQDDMPRTRLWLCRAHKEALMGWFHREGCGP